MNRRRHPRSKSMKGTRINWRSNGEYLHSLISDLSLGGAFIHTPEPAPEATALTVLLDAPSSAIRSSAVVRHSIPNQGMGVEFKSMTSDDQARLASLLRMNDAPKAKNKSRKIHHEHQENVAAAPPADPGPQEKVVEDPNSNNTSTTEIQQGREQDRPSLASGEPNPPGRGKGTSGEAVKDFRRSSRLCFEMPVRIYICRENEEPIFEESKTLTVNAHGALLALTTPVEFGQTLQIINSRTQIKIECRVCRFGMRYPTGLTQVGVEFLAMSPTFWDIPNPPLDWDPAWVPPSGRKPLQRPFPTNADRLEPFLTSPASGPELCEPGTQLADLAGDVTNLDTPAVAVDSAIPIDAKRKSRRSTRLQFEIPVVVQAQEENKEAFPVEGKTVSVSLNGALLAVAEVFVIGQSLLLTNSKTGKEIVCHVRSVQENGTGMNYVVVEFATVSPKFWGLSFVPEDWDDAQRKLPQRPLPTKSAPLKPLLKDSLYHSLLSNRRTINSEIQQEEQESLKASEGRTKTRGWRVFRWPIIALAACVALFIIWASVRRASEGGSAALQNSTSAGVAPDDALLIPRIERFRLATGEDFDPDAVSWLRGSGQQVSGKIPGVYSGHDNSSAYILISKENARRVVILADRQTRYDAEYPVIAIASRVPKETIQKISWADPSPPESDGDGLLIVRAADAPTSGVVLFLRGSRVVSASPVDYRQIPLSQLP